MNLLPSISSIPCTLLIMLNSAMDRFVRISVPPGAVLEKPRVSHEGNGRAANCAPRSSTVKVHVRALKVFNALLKRRKNPPICAYRAKLFNYETDYDVLDGPDCWAGDRLWRSLFRERYNRSRRSIHHEYHGHNSDPDVACGTQWPRAIPRGPSSSVFARGSNASGTPQHSRRLRRKYCHQC